MGLYFGGKKKKKFIEYGEEQWSLDRQTYQNETTKMVKTTSGVIHPSPQLGATAETIGI